jgi:hypothetical protein
MMVAPRIPTLGESGEKHDDIAMLFPAAHEVQSDAAFRLKAVSKPAKTGSGRDAGDASIILASACGLDSRVDSAMGSSLNCRTVPNWQRLSERSYPV